MAAAPSLAQSQRWPAQSVRAGPVLAAARLAGAGAAAPTLTVATGGDDGGIIASVSRSAAGTYLATLKTTPKLDANGLPVLRVTSQLLDEGAANPPIGWNVVLGRATYSGTAAQVEIFVYDETDALADLDTAAFLDLTIFADCGVI